jgi:DNA-binding transcriptional regulator GbsR (MarR family)
MLLPRPRTHYGELRGAQAATLFLIASARMQPTRLAERVSAEAVARRLLDSENSDVDIPVISVLTEIMKMTPLMEKFIVHWGEMGAKWGVNRSVAQIHALLYITGKALPADEIVELLSIARSNVSTGLKELQSWGIVRVTHVLGDRRDHFEAIADVWETFRLILRERKRREADPTLQMLRDCVSEADGAKKSTADEAVIQERLNDMLEFFETAHRWGERASALSPATLKRFAQMGDAAFRLVGS